jgi:hypothetical protein
MVAPAAAVGLQGALQGLRLPAALRCMAAGNGLLLLQEALPRHSRRTRGVAAYEHVVWLDIAVRQRRLHLVHGTHAAADLRSPAAALSPAHAGY